MLFHMSEEKPYLAHARYATAGKVCSTNIHMFEQGDWLISMNGTISGFADKKANDTRLAIQILATIPRKKDKIKFMEMWEARFLCINRKTKEVVRTGKWFEKEGVQYSKNNVLQTFQNRTTTSPYSAYGAGVSGYGGGYYQNDAWDGGWDAANKNKVNKKSKNKKKSEAEEYVLVNDMWVTKSSVQKGSYGTKKDNRSFGLLGGSNKTNTQSESQKASGIITTSKPLVTYTPKIMTEASGLVIVSVYGYLLSNYKTKAILSKGMCLGRSSLVTAMSMVEHHGTAYMLPMLDDDSMKVETITYQLTVDQYKELFNSACAPSYVVPVRRSVCLADGSNSTVLSYIFTLNKKEAISTVNHNKRLIVSKKVEEMQRNMAV